MIGAIKRRINDKILHYLDYAVTKRGQMQRSGDCIRVCDVRGIVVLLNAESEIESFRADSYATKEPETLDWIQRSFQPGDVVYDVGANIGLYSLFAAKYLQSRCKVYAFEPEGLNFGKLNKNVYINGLSGIVLPCCIAVTDRLCFDTFHIHPNIYAADRLGEGLVAGSALHSFGAAVDYTGTEFRPVHQQGSVAASLDYLWQQFGLEVPNHIKIDVDGLEQEIINGGERTLEDKRLRSVLVEISAERGGQDPIYQRLTEVGFHAVTDFAEHSSRQLKGTPYEGCVNTVFVRS